MGSSNTRPAKFLHQQRENYLTKSCENIFQSKPINEFKFGALLLSCYPFLSTSLSPSLAVLTNCQFIIGFFFAVAHE